MEDMYNAFVRENEWDGDTMTHSMYLEMFFEWLMKKTSKPSEGLRTLRMHAGGARSDFDNYRRGLNEEQDRVMELEEFVSHVSDTEC